jgi:fluoroquinolone resistance protein
MNQECIEQQLFTKQDYTETPLPKGEYDTCNFRDCTFSGSDLSRSRFSDCSFKGCDLSNVKVLQSSFQECIFKECKMLGIHFENCDQLGLTFRFENCQLNHSSFYQVKLNHTVFQKSSLREVDFSESDLRNSLFDECDLLAATFDHSNLERANLSTAINYSIDPESNRIRGAKFSLPSVVGLLSKYQVEIE